MAIVTLNILYNSGETRFVNLQVDGEWKGEDTIKEIVEKFGEISYLCAMDVVTHEGVFFRIHDASHITVVGREG